MHDIGKIGIPDELLCKPEELVGREWLLVRQHPEIGYRILSSIKFLRGAAQIVLHHHECYDGNGYPQGLKGDQIHIGARIFAVADALDDLTSNGRLRPTLSFESAAEKLKKCPALNSIPKWSPSFCRFELQDGKRCAGKSRLRQDVQIF